MNEKSKQAIEYITKRKKLISKKLDKDQQSLELLGEYQSSDKQWFGWCNEFDILSYIETVLKQAEENEKELNELREFAKIIFTKELDIPILMALYRHNKLTLENYNDNCCGRCYEQYKLTQTEFDLIKKGGGKAWEKRRLKN